MKQIKKEKLKQAFEIIQEISSLTRLSTVELVMTVLDYKPAMADAIFLDSQLEKNMEQIRDYAQQIGLYLATSDYKYIVNSPRGIFKEIPLNDPRLGKIIIALSKSEDKARKGADYYHKKQIDGIYGYKFGKLMGYPECCLKFGYYLNNNNGDPNNFGFKNPAIESLKNSKYIDWRLNVFSSPLLSHFPCSFTCKESIKYVERFLACLDYIDKERGLFFKDRLTKPTSLYWTCADRILLYGDFKPYTLGTGEIKYHKIEPEITSDTYYQDVDKKKITQWRNIEKYLLQGNKLIVTDDLCSIYQDKKKVFEIKKDNRFIPVLIKPGIFTLKKQINKTVIFAGYRCNNRCTFCINYDKRKIHYPSYLDVKKEILSAKKRGRTYLEIIGGEPTVRPDIISLIKYAKELNFDTIMIATNGRMLSYEDFARTILKAGLNSIIFSIHGHTAKLHDLLTQAPGSFEQLNKGVKNVQRIIKELNLKVSLGTNTTIVKQNYKYLPQIGEYIRNLGLYNAEFIFVDPSYGGAYNDFERIVPRISDVAPFVHKCLDIGKKYKIPHWHIRYVPLCHFQNYLDQISELQEIQNYSSVEHIAPDFYNPNVSENRKLIGRLKPERCQGCKLHNQCEGIWKEYLKHYGNKELKPVK